MKAIWTGTVGFGLVNIPVKLYSAIEDSALDFDMLDKKDHSNIKFKRINEHTGKEVAWENIVKGFKLNEKYVILNDNDFEKAIPEKTDHIEIDQFVDEQEIDSSYFEQPYYLEPQKNWCTGLCITKRCSEKIRESGCGFVCNEKPGTHMYFKSR